MSFWLALHKTMVEISQNFVAFWEYMNFKSKIPTFHEENIDIIVPLFSWTT